MRRLADELLEHRRRVELAGEHAAGARQLLREPPCDSLRFEGPAAVESSARRLCDPAPELEIVGNESAFLPEEDDDQPASVTLDRESDQGLEVHLAPDAVEALVAAGARRRDDACIGGGLR